MIACAFPKVQSNSFFHCQHNRIMYMYMYMCIYMYVHCTIDPGIDIHTLLVSRYKMYIHVLYIYNVHLQPGDLDIGIDRLRNELTTTGIESRGEDARSSRQPKSEILGLIPQRLLIFVIVNQSLYIYTCIIVHIHRCITPTIYTHVV